MAKPTKKIPFLKTPPDALTGDFKVVRPAFGPRRFTWAQIEAAVRKVNRARREAMEIEAKEKAARAK